MLGDKRLRSVLVVDDDADVCRVLADLIKVLSPSTMVWTAFDGAQAVASTSVHRPQVVFLDLEMPVLDGAGAAAAIVLALGGEAPTLIALSGNPSKLESVASLGLFDQRLLKPISIVRLVELLKVIPAP